MKKFIKISYFIPFILWTVVMIASIGFKENWVKLLIFFCYIWTLLAGILLFKGKYLIGGIVGVSLGVFLVSISLKYNQFWGMDFSWGICLIAAYTGFGIVCYKENKV